MNNKQKIILKALSLFALRGYDAVGVQEICEACGVTKPTLYHYFTNKRGLLDAILAEYYPPFIENIRQALEYHHDIVMNLEALSNVFFNFAQKAPDFNRFSLTAMFSPRESEAHIAQKKYVDTINHTVEEMFTLATTDHGNMRNKQKQFALSFTGLLRVYVGLYLCDETVLNESITRTIVKQYMHGIFS